MTEDEMRALLDVLAWDARGYTDAETYDYVFEDWVALHNRTALRDVRDACRSSVRAS